MANNAELRTLSYARIRSSRILMDANDWDGAAYLMGYALETALKSASCKALKLSDYPERTTNKQIDSCFMSHKFDQLLVISGLSDLFSITGNVNSFRNWSDFVQEYQGDWVNMRYNPQQLQTFDKIKVERLFRNLYDDPDSIIKTIGGKRRW